MTKSKTTYPTSGRRARRLEIVAFSIEGLGWCYGQKLGPDQVFAFFDRVTPTIEPVERLDDAKVVHRCVYIGDGERDGRWSIIGSRSFVPSVPSEFVLWSYVDSGVRESSWDVRDGRMGNGRPASEEEVRTAFTDAIFSAKSVEETLSKLLGGEPDWEYDDHKKMRAIVLARMRARRAGA